MEKLLGGGCIDEEGMRERVIVALDVSSREEAFEILEKLKGRVRFVKVGFELFLQFGKADVERLGGEGLSIFFDHKFFDIGRTVEAGVRSVSRMGARCVTVHAEPHTMRAAVAGRDSEGSECKILAVTVLTNMVDEDIHAMGIDKGMGVRELVRYRANQALDCGVDGVIASVHEAPFMGKGLVVVTPGVREKGEVHGDQRRVSDVESAVRGGSDYIVVGRAVVKSSSPREVFDRYVSLMMKSYDALAGVN